MEVPLLAGPLHHAHRMGNLRFNHTNTILLQNIWILRRVDVDSQVGVSVTTREVSEGVAGVCDQRLLDRPIFRQCRDGLI